MSNGYGKAGVFHLRWSDGCGAASPPVEEVGPSVVFDAAFDGEQGVGARFRPAAPRPLEPAPDDLLAGAFHDAGSDRQAALPAKVVAHPASVGLEVVDAGRDGFVPVAVRLQAVDDAGDLPVVQLLLDLFHPRLPPGLVRSQGLHCGGRLQPVRQLEEACA